MKLSQASSTLLTGAIKQAVKKFATGNEQTVVTDIHFQPNQSSGELCIFDDEDTELAFVTIEEWMTYEADDFYDTTQRILSNLLTELKKQGTFDALCILKPYSFVLVDEDRETVAELLLMDDDTLLVNDELLKGLDQELDEFLKNLLKD